MTSACELFSRRSRPLFRNPNPNPHVSFDPTLSFDPHRRRRPIRHLRRRDLEEEHNLVQSDNSSPNQLTLIRSGQGNERLPDTVLQARARLLERLHGISFSENRRSTSAFNLSHNDSNDENDFEITDSGDWEIETPREWIESDVQFTDLAANANQAMPLHNICKKKPPGLTLETIHSLPQECFKDGQETDGIMRVSLECAICLESFCEGDRLLLLPCCHRFHPSCLEPWLENFGDCPYCRASI